LEDEADAEAGFNVAGPFVAVFAGTTTGLAGAAETFAGTVVGLAAV
jgi:hypothetical protein